MNENPLSTSPTPAAHSLENAASDLRSAVDDFTSSASEKATAVKNRAVETAEALGATATEKVEHYKTLASEKACLAKASAQHCCDEARKKAKELQEITADYIRQNPSKSILVAIGAGFLVGLIIRKSSPSL